MIDFVLRCSTVTTYWELFYLEVSCSKYIYAVVIFILALRKKLTEWFIW